MQRKIECIYPTSPVQKALLLSSQHAGSVGTNIEQIVFRLSGPLDLAAFSKACQHLVDQHAIFRTAFVWTDAGGSFQVVSRDVTVPLCVEDWSSVAESQVPERLRELARCEKVRGFNPAKAPLLRIRCIRLHVQGTALIWTHHHALLDGWCLPILFRELFRAYSSYANGKMPEVHIRRPYQDYIQWLRQQDHKQAELFWKETLAGFETLTTILGHEQLIERAAGDSANWSDETVQLPVETTMRLQAACQRLKVTMNTLVQAAWGLLLGLYSSETDVVFGATVSGRPASLAGVEEMIGPFFNSIPVRIRLTDTMNLQQWLTEIQRRQAKARQYEHVSTNQLCDWIGWPSGASLFETLVVFQNYPSDPFDLSDVEGQLSLEEASSPVRSFYPLTLSVTVGSRMDLVLAFATSRFRKIDIVRMLRLMERALKALAECGAEQRVGDLAWLEAEDIAHLVRLDTEESCNCASAIAQLAGTPACILIAGRQHAPAGLVGELYICSSGATTQGSHQRAATVNSRAECALELHPSGLLARWTEAGKIMILGRLDRRIRVGQRWVLADEIETVLSEHPDIAHSAVVFDDALVAHIVPVRPGIQLDFDALKRFARLHLPEHMVPVEYVQTSALPKDAEGRVDEDALKRMGTRSRYPETATEEIIGSLWSQLTGAGPLSIDDSLLLLCGNSLVATQLISRICSIFGIQMPISAFFERPTIAALAAKVDLQRRQGTRKALPLTAGMSPEEATYPASFAQERLWFLDQFSPGNPSYNVPLLFRITGVLDYEALELAIAQLVTRHEVLRTRFVNLRGVPRQVVDEPVVSYLPIIDLRLIEEPQRARRVDDMLRALALEPFNLSSGPLIRDLLLCTALDDHYLIFNMHHVVFDGWSAGILMRELVELYQANAGNRQPALPPMELQYKDFAVWQRKTFDAGGYDSEIEFWKRQLTPEPKFSLPTDYARPRSRTYTGGSLRFECSQETTRNVEAIRKSEGATILMVLLSAFQALLSACTGAHDIVVATDVANREQPETENMIGFFVNQVLLRTDLSGNPSFREVIARTRKTCLAAYDNQSVPFSKVIEALRPHRTAAQQPLFQILFVLQNTPLRVPSPASGLVIETLLLELPFSNFELSLFMTDSARQLGGLWVFNTDLFAPETIRKLSSDFLTLLEHAVRNPDTRLDSLAALIETPHATVQRPAVEQQFGPDKKRVVGVVD